MKRRNFLMLMAALAGAPMFPKVAAKLAKSKSPVPPIPVGYISPHTGPVPAGWLPCDGRMIAPNQYPKLCEVLGKPFKLPDLVGKQLYTDSEKGPAFIHIKYMVKT